MTAILLNLLKSLLIESVARHLAISALKAGVKLARLGSKATTNQVDDVIVDAMEETVDVVIDTWNSK